MTRFVWPTRVYWEDTDAGGIVYYANYMKFMERARTEWLRSLGIEQTPLKEEQGLMFVVVDIAAHFRKPARYGELLQVTCTVAEAARASLTFEQEVYRDRLDGELLLDGRLRVACLDTVRYRPRPLPKSLVDQMTAGDQ
ncbi:MAG: tol-pal system-associated acyl-CoA thioesterase [Steroidobacteraceae bacterium]